MQNANTEVITPDQEFDWDAYEKTCPNYRKKNKIFSGKDVIYDNNPESQKLYQMMLESSMDLVIPKQNAIVKGTISTISGRYAYVDIGWRESACLDLNKEASQYVEKFHEGAEIDIILKTVKLGTKEEVIEGSHTEVVKHLKYQEIYQNIGQSVAFSAYVKELIHGGYFLDIEGVEVFMPGSLGGVNKLVDFESLLGQTIYVVPINYAKDKNII